MKVVLRYKLLNVLIGSKKRIIIYLQILLLCFKVSSQLNYNKCGLASVNPALVTIT